MPPLYPNEFHPEYELIFDTPPIAIGGPVALLLPPPEPPVVPDTAKLPALRAPPPPPPIAVKVDPPIDIDELNPFPPLI